MGVEWIPAAVAGAVGVVGIVFTFASGQFQQATQRRIAAEQLGRHVADLRRSERNSAYTKFLTAALHFEHQHTEISSLHPGDARRSDFENSIRQTRNELIVATAEIKMVGSEIVQRRLRAMSLEIAALINHDLGTMAADVATAGRLAASQQLLQDAMHEDLESLLSAKSEIRDSEFKI